MVHYKVTGIHTMDFHPLAGLASFSLQLETSRQSSAEGGGEGGSFFLATRAVQISEGRGGVRGEGRNAGREG